MIKDGVSEFKALTMYYAVYRFGPRWTVAMQTNCPPGFACVIKEITRVDITKTQPKPSLIDEADLKQDFSDIEKFIQETNPSLDVIEIMASQKAAAPVEVSKKTLLGIDARNYGNPTLNE